MQRDLIVSFLASVPSKVLSQFKDRPLTIVSPITQKASGKWLGGAPGYRQWLAQFADSSGAVIPGLARAAGAQPGDTIGRVCVLGFSNGCSGVESMLRASDSAKIDTVLAIDGIHGSYVNGGLDPSRYKRFLNHGVRVMRADPELPSSPVMVISHSSILPPGFPSTSETASLIWEMVMTKALPDVLTGSCGWPCPPVLHESSIAADNQQVMKACSQGRCYDWKGITDGWFDRRYAGNFFVLGWGDNKGGKITTKDPRGYCDHVFQGQQVLRAMLEEFCVKRWQVACGPVAVVGVGESDPSVCKLKEGIVYSESAAEKIDFFPDLQSVPALPKPVPCPPPPPGSVIVGAPGDPCATSPLPGQSEPVPSAPPGPSTAPDTGGNAGASIALALGVAAGAWGVSKLFKRRR